MTDYTHYVATQHPAVALPPRDLETRITDKESPDIRLWLRMLSCCNLIETEVRSRLRTEFQTTLPRFDLLSQLTHTPKGLKMSELSRLMMVSNGNITGIADQLEKDGLIERQRNETDRRSSLLRLTQKGRRYYRRMQSAHDSWIQSLLGGMAPSARSSLFELLGDLKRTTHTRLPVA
ncbi:MarR family winged helix-turn-helix transcriptional regulator [Castellaniella sp.]|uniref:MarR family winged helix-turn-helix transcriptional regulator n=1 Tax=Castellaniella sp. TaxID=1955812 RepID=UPI003C720C44